MNFQNVCLLVMFGIEYFYNVVHYNIEDIQIRRAEALSIKGMFFGGNQSDEKTKQGEAVTRDKGVIK